ncbi:MAG: CoA ester lyase [Boseongicola sp. SB0675_bin_26]|nr:CoA ester lyase [Boseongicola sp. SB0675_bin_26]
MAAPQRLCRSVLYVPASKTRALEKVGTLDVDSVIFDLEDAVAPAEKLSARETLARALDAGDFGHRQRIVRINGTDTEWGDADARAVAGMKCDAVLLPKAEDPGQVEQVAALVPGTPVWCMMETPRGVLNAPDIAALTPVEGFVLGTNDLAKEIGCSTGGDRMAMMTALQAVLLAARTTGIACVDGVYNAFRDEDGFRAECEQGRALGMDGKTLIHPSQIGVANAVFAPSEAETELARRQIEAYDDAIARGEAVAVVDGRIVENLHVETARAVLAKADAIRERAGA